MKYQTRLIVITILSSLGVSTVYAADEEGKNTEAVKEDRCKAPAWAVAIGHEEKWRLHNGCTTESKKKNNNSTSENKTQ